MGRPLKAICAGLFLLGSSIGFAQVTDSFDDNNFTLSPPWAGDDSKFVVDNFSLRLQAPAQNGSAYLSTNSESINNASWEFFIRMDFNPSGSNYAKVFLVADQPDLNVPLNGYYVLLGNTEDEVSLYRQSGTTSVKIIDGVDGLLNLATVNAKIKVTRDDIGGWELFADVGDTGNYTSQGTIVDQFQRSSSFFGVQCTYTSTRSDKFNFDDFAVSGDPYVDNEAPSILSVEINSQTSLTINFNEPLGTSAQNRENYQINRNVGTPLTVELLNSDQSISLIFANSFQNGFDHELKIENIADKLGNQILPSTQNFFFFQYIPEAAKDVIISEIFPDPNPQIQLPDGEFVEIYNRSEKPFNLSGWTLSDGNSKALLPERYLLPKEYLVLTANSNASKFGIITNVLGLPNFPTLNNSTDTITLRSTQGITIDSINYDLSWYRDIDKQEGGWSLEIIDVNNLCEEKENWTSSENDKGGTPGFGNSVAANKPDLTGPQLKGVVAKDERLLELIFDEKLETPLSSSLLITIEPSTPISSYSFADKTLRSIEVSLSAALLPKQLYTVKVTNVFDCSGNKVQDDFNSVSFALPEVAEPLDISINEILFNPRPGGSDFVEIYNRSDKYINLKNWLVGNFSEVGIENIEHITVDDLIIGPAEYLVLTPDPENIKMNYPQGRESTFRKVALPSLPDDGGSFALASPTSEIIDAIDYSRSFHSVFLQNDEGVSLERISNDADTNTQSNWTSCASTAGFATPGLINSAFKSASQIADGDVIVDPPIFSASPASNEFSQIQFRFDQPGFIANVTIFDQQGRLIKNIANNELLGTQGSFRWDGDLEDGTRARSGYYVVWFEVFDESGNVRSFRKRVVIASR